MLINNPSDVAYFCNDSHSLKSSVDLFQGLVGSVPLFWWYSFHLPVYHMHYVTYMWQFIQLNCSIVYILHSIVCTGFDSYASINIKQCFYGKPFQMLYHLSQFILLSCLVREHALSCVFILLCIEHVCSFIYDVLVLLCVACCVLHHGPAERTFHSSIFNLYDDWQ